MCGNGHPAGYPRPVFVHGRTELAALTTLELGGSAADFAEVDGVDQAFDALKWAAEAGRPVAVLGGGSNVVIADDGWPGLVIRPRLRGIEADRDGDTVLVTVGAGEVWDEVVEWAVGENLAGIECLSGIPGWAGATPIQNVGAYGQEIASVLSAVTVLDSVSMKERRMSCAECGLGYRTSRFKAQPSRFLVLRVELVLVAGGRPKLTYPELREAVGSVASSPSLSVVRDAVLALRNRKSMVVDSGDPNRRSAGSFFLNPVIDSERILDLEERARSSGALAPGAGVPAFSAPGGMVKVSAAWLVECAGFPKGFRRGNVGISSRHALALVHHGGGSAADLVGLAGEIRAAVGSLFGIWLEAEPTFLGFPEDVLR